MSKVLSTASLFLLVVLASPVASAPLLTTQHVDIAVANGSNLVVRWHDADNGVYHAAGAAVAFVDPAKGRGVRPDAEAWDFIGVGPGETFLRLTAGQNPHLLYLGFGAEDATTTAFSTWNPRDSARGVTSTQRWIQVRLTAWDGPGDFSVYSVVSGQPRVWFATRDGVTPSDTADSLYLLAGGHTHYNFAFSRRGDYRIHLQIRALQSGQWVTSDAVLAFTTELKLEIQPAPLPGMMDLRWPGVSDGILLQENPGLDAGGWVPSPGPATDDGQWKSVRVPVDGKRFFRLAKP